MTKYPKWTFKKLNPNGKIPYELLLLADPSKELVDAYLNNSEIFIATQNQKTLGVIVILPLMNSVVEIKNIAVLPELQGQSIGSFLIKNAIEFAMLNGNKCIRIGTAIQVWDN